MSKKISIILPVYNTGKYLNRCIDSLLAQDFKNFELIFINDASTDNSLEILEEFANKNNDLDVKIISNRSNRGQSYSKNIAINQAIGEYLAFIDSDDFISNNFLSEMAKVAERTNAEIVMCDLLGQDSNTLEFNKTSTQSSKNNKSEFSTFIEKFSLISNGSCCNKLFKTKLIKENYITFPEGIVFEDNEFLVKAVFFANKISKIDTCSYFYCHNEKSTTRAKSNGEKLKRSASTLLNNIFDFFEDKNLNKKEKYVLTEFCVRSFCLRYIQDDDFQISTKLNKEDIDNIIRVITKPKYTNFFQRIFSLKNTTKKTKILTILFVQIPLKRKSKKDDR